MLVSMLTQQASTKCMKVHEEFSEWNRVGGKR